jgi:hypothetical protein
MATATGIRWTIEVSKETDADLRDYLASANGSTSTDEAISQFVQQAVREQLFRETARKIKDANAHLSEREVMDAVDEALEWARSPEGREC